MSSLIKYHEGINSIAVIGNYSPRQCGIATFTTDVVEALSAESTNIDCWAVVMNDIPEGYQYPEKVHFEINQNKLSDYSVAAEFININQIDIVCLQHEYGIFGGPAGSNILKLLSDLRMPVVTTLHTILKDPSPEYREVTNKLVTLSDKLVVMSEKTREFLIDIYSVPEEKIVFIHHGIHDTPFIDPNFYKDQFGVDINWLLTGEGEPYIDRQKDEGVYVKEPAPSYNAREREGEKRGTEILGARPPEGSIHEQFKLSEALTAAARVLESRTSYAVILHLNIQHFDRAIRAETRITQLEEKNERLEKRMFNLEKKILETETSKRSADESGERKVA